MLSLLCLYSILVRQLCNEAKKEIPQAVQWGTKREGTKQKFCCLRLQWMKCNKIKNATENISNSRKIFEAQDKKIEISQPEDKEAKRMKRCERTCANFGITFTVTTCTLLESQKEETGIVLQEITPDKLHIWWDLGLQVHVTNRSPLRVHSKWSSPRHIIYNQDKERILEASR